MTVAIVVLSCIFGALFAGFLALYRYTRTPAWSRSDLRMTTMSFLITIGPMFGVRIKPDDPELPAVMTPGPEPEDIEDHVVVRERKDE